jgi:hypothetical protein
MPTWSESAGLRYASLGAHTQCPHAYLRVYSARARARLSPGADVAIDAVADVGLSGLDAKAACESDVCYLAWSCVSVTTPPASPTARPCGAACKHDLTSGQQQRATDAVALACARAGGIRRCVACMHARIHTRLHARTYAGLHASTRRRRRAPTRMLEHMCTRLLTLPHTRNASTGTS